MTAERFEEVFNEQMDYCRDLLIQKSKEYAIKNPDRLQHFKRTAGFLKTTPEDALVGMLSKHLISVVDMCRDPEPEKYPIEQWTEKITDTINYLLLLKGIVVEREAEKTGYIPNTPERVVDATVTLPKPRTRGTANIEVDNG